MADEKGKKGSAPNTKACSNCLTPEGGEFSLKLSACVRCGTVVYCSKECQRAHWNAGHKQRCIAKADRIPASYGTNNSCDKAASVAAATGEECSICLGSLANASATTLQCTHVFHFECVAELRKFGVKQACPLCRTPLAPGPEKLNDEASLRYMIIDRMVTRGLASWSTLPPEAQSEVDAAISIWQAAAEQGSAMAQHNLGCVLQEGCGAPQSEAEAVRWFRKAAEQGFSKSQFKLG